MKLAILGSTGSIGTQALELLSVDETHPVVALSAGRNVALLAEQVRRFKPRYACVYGAPQAQQLAGLLGDNRDVEILHGANGLVACAAQSGAGCVLNALVGAVGLAPTLAALEAGVDVALANKESLVVGGALVRRALQRSSAKLIPVDSEHSALWQLLAGRAPEEVERVWITASGGALRGWPVEKLKSATPKDVLQHPNWSMGSRITVDSATLVNKAFELIEARWLFELPFEKIRALIHPPSVVHGMVTLCDGAVLAHLGSPDMKMPIQYALSAPEHRPLPVPRLDWEGLTLGFSAVDVARYPAFETVLAAGRLGHTAPAALNAADEVLVERFLAGELPFTQISAGLEAVLQCYTPEPLSLASIERADRWARRQATLFARDTL